MLATAVIATLSVGVAPSLATSPGVSPGTTTAAAAVPAKATAVKAIGGAPANPVADAVARAAATSSAKHSYSSPGYHWNGKLPKVAPVVPGKVIHLGDGENPHVVVDAAGTGQIAYTTRPQDLTAESVAHDCVLKRGQTSCTTNQSLTPPATSPDYSIDNEGPSPLILGNQLLMLSYRYPDQVTLPDNKSGDPMWMWISDDGGHTFPAPGIIGNLEASGNAITYGGKNPQIAWITDTMTGGTTFQSASAASYQPSRLDLTPSNEPNAAYNGRLALDGDRPVAAFSDASDTIVIREYSGSGDIMQGSNWSTTIMKGQGYTRLVSGPSGVWLLFQKTYGGDLFVQRIVNGKPSGSAEAVTPNTDFQHAYYAINEDSTGQLTVGWFHSVGIKSELFVRTSNTHGTTWGAPQLVAKDLDSPSYMQLAAGPDGGGFATFTTPEAKVPSGDSGSQVDVAAFGSFLSTGQKGLGNLNGDGMGGLGGDPLATSSCTDIHFGAIDALAEAGCFLRDPTNPTSGAAVATGTIRLNGLEIIPDVGAKIAIDPRQHTINTTGQVSVVLRTPGIGDITLYHGEIHLNLSGSLADPGQLLFDFNLSAATSTVEGFPFSTSIDVYLKNDAVEIPASLALPAYMGGITANATLLANNTDGFVLKSLHIGVADLPLGALEISNLSIDYASDGDVWKGSAHIDIPAGSAYFSIDASVEFDGGDFTKGSFTVTVPYPGVPIFEDTYLTGFGGSFDIHPANKQFSGTINIGAIPLDPPNYTIGVSGTVSITFPQNGPVVVTVDGSGTIHGEQVATAHAVFQTNGFFEVKGNLDLDLDVVEISSSIDAFADLPNKTFSAEITGDLQLVGEDIASVDGIVSSKGAGACGSYFGLKAGFGYTWGGSAQIFWGSCDFGPYRVPPTAGEALRTGHARVERVSGVPVAKGATVENFEVHGSGGAPTVTLTDPSGHTTTPPALSSTTAKGGSFQVADAAKDVTYVSVAKPAAGSWTVAAASGSVPISEVRGSQGYAAATVAAHVGGKGRARTLGYHFSGPPGMQVQFAERGAHSYKVLGTTTKSHGTLHFSPANGPAGVRTITAVLSENGSPVRHVTVAHYKAPAPPRPGKVSGLRVKRHGKVFRISFGKASNAARYVVHAVASDGHRYTWVISKGAHKRAVKAIGYKDRVTVTVAGVSSQQLTGPSRKASASYETAVYKKAHHHKKKKHHKHKKK